tara:strand:- start:15229 stop:15522 length:294 start_codon:yes stop_codon:yes gene_type:complete
MFEPGDKVICVNDRDIDPLGIKIHGGKHPIENQLYCIEDCWSDNDIIFAVSLVGMPARPKTFRNARFGWFAWRFRKVEELRDTNRASKSKGVKEPAK